MKHHQLTNALKGALYFLLPICREASFQPWERRKVQSAVAELLEVLSEIDEQLDCEIGEIIEKVIASLNRPQD